MSAIRIPKGSINLAGLLFKPASLSDKAPGLVVIHPGGGVKEQTASTYAKRLSDQGFVAICYDASHQGDSEGLPHFLEDPSARVTDASAVVDYLERLDYVDMNRIAVVGICAGGGYAAAAAKGDHRLKAVAMVSAVNIGDGARFGWYGNEQPSSQVANLDQVAQAIQAEAQGTEAATAPYVPPTPGDNTPVDLADAYNYYCTPRAQHKNAQNKMLLRSVPLVLNFDAWQFADLFLTQPVLIVVGEKAESRWHSEKIYKILEGKNNNVKKVVVPDGRHMDFYDKDDFVNPAIADIVDSFTPVMA
ncbi:uncharacterized protein Z519_04436 [Cladophialophora bantiana CBS 173.52]|uniref:Dienelactone hydrolase domain-containing protein n=1 Tax=Cladophialophora bantiana (strain ATCC 10958 / CBS 173.52 / CDC B-1940 / NIH 8579) TaxID=1442370 RepID=A0A0D2HUA5_CLAB1|nr:uncharacterized protein Z519_04436 [Cladophialophora bantiana CBS 173.52]KIW94460.1 hypothetical protein Z519_04436 [Cladophialophora bantiana CBS 173.52]